MGILMLSLLGFPVFGGAGFFAKWYVLQAALQSPERQLTLAVVLVLTSVVSAGYYLWVVMLMFMRGRADDAPAIESSGGMTRVVLAISVAGILFFGLAPNYAIAIANFGKPVMEDTPSLTGLPPVGATTTAPPDSAARLAAAGIR
jgi:NADH-quinone oxidoreductase subunit N